MTMNELILILVLSSFQDNNYNKLNNSKSFSRSEKKTVKVSHNVMTRNIDSKYNY